MMNQQSRPAPDRLLESDPLEGFMSPNRAPPHQERSSEYNDPLLKHLRALARMTQAAFEEQEKRLQARFEDLHNLRTAQQNLLVAQRSTLQTSQTVLRMLEQIKENTANGASHTRAVPPLLQNNKENAAHSMPHTRAVDPPLQQEVFTRGPRQSKAAMIRQKKAMKRLMDPEKAQASAVDNSAFDILPPGVQSPSALSEAGIQQERIPWLHKNPWSTWNGKYPTLSSYKSVDDLGVELVVRDVFVGIALGGGRTHSLLELDRQDRVSKKRWRELNLMAKSALDRKAIAFEAHRRALGHAHQVIKTMDQPSEDEAKESREWVTCLDVTILDAVAEIEEECREAKIGLPAFVKKLSKDRGYTVEDYQYVMFGIPKLNCQSKRQRDE